MQLLKSIPCAANACCRKATQPSKGIIMKVTVIGAGNMGSAFVKQLTPRRPPGQRHRARRRQGGAGRSRQPRRKAVPTAGAPQGADVVVLATGYADAVAALKCRRRSARQGGHRHHQSADGRLHGPDPRPQHVGRRRDRQGRPGRRSRQGLQHRVRPGAGRRRRFRQRAEGQRSSSPATARAPSRPPKRWPRAWASTPSTPAA